MPIVKVENRWNSTLTLTQNERRWQLIGLLGLNPPAADIMTTTIPYTDGARFNTSRLQMRNVVITLALTEDVERGRTSLNSVIMAKQPLRVYYKNNTVDVYIDGYVESFEYDVFNNIVTAQVSILCPAPYWVSVKQQTVDVTPVISLFEFPFSLPVEGIAVSEMKLVRTETVEYAGTVQTGVEISITCLNAISSPVVTNRTTGETMTFTGLTLVPGQTLRISTVQGKKSVQLVTESETTNAINAMDLGNQWIMVMPGTNVFEITAESGADDVRATITVSEKYGGV